jgi:hypothetical protein
MVFAPFSMAIPSVLPIAVALMTAVVCILVVQLLFLLHSRSFWLPLATRPDHM